MPATDEAQLEVAIGLRESGDLDAAHRLRCVLVSRIMARDGRTTQEAQVALSQLGRTLRAMGRLTAAWSRAERGRS